MRSLVRSFALRCRCVSRCSIPIALHEHLPDGPQPDVARCGTPEHTAPPRTRSPHRRTLRSSGVRSAQILYWMTTKSAAAINMDRLGAEKCTCSSQWQRAQPPAARGVLHDHRHSFGGAQHDEVAGARAPAWQQIDRHSEGGL